MQVEKNPVKGLQGMQKASEAPVWGLACPKAIVSSHSHWEKSSRMGNMILLLNDGVGRGEGGGARKPGPDSSHQRSSFIFSFPETETLFLHVCNL